jgi:hypothetical protein
MLGTPPLSYSSPPVSRVKAPDSPTQSPASEVKNMMNDRWPGMLYWSCGESVVCASILATDWVRNPCVHLLLELLLVEDLRLCRRPTTWPRDLRLEIIEAGIGALDIQTWILHHKAPLARIRSTPKIGKQDFGELVKTMRKGRHVSRHDSPQACLSRIGRSELCVGRSKPKVLPSRALFWSRFMKLYSVWHSRPLTYLSFRKPARRLHSRSHNKRRSCNRITPLHLILLHWSSRREISSITGRMPSRLGH